jgi:hypothetical protein
VNIAVRDTKLGVATQVFVVADDVLVVFAAAYQSETKLAP